jgi:hypothetical protein
MKGGFGQLPAIADGVLAEQVARLKAYVETGNTGREVRREEGELT